MLVIAKTVTGEMIHARDAMQGIDYICLHCGQIVYVRTSKRGKCFYHLQTSSHKGINEGDFHKQAKQLWIDWSQSEHIKLAEEVIIGEQRADLLWENQVIEIQNSPITSQELSKRHQGYLQANLNDLWMAGPRFYYSHQSSQKLVQYHPQLGCYLFEVHPQEQVVVLWYHLTSVKATTQKKVFNTSPFTSLPCLKECSINTSYVVQKRYKLIESYSHCHHQKLAELINLCYKHCYPFWDRLNWLLLPVSLPYQTLMQELEWKIYWLGWKKGWDLDLPENPHPLIVDHFSLLADSFQQQIDWQQRNGCGKDTSFLAFAKTSL